MSSVPSMPQQPVAVAERSASVVMGRQNFLSVLLRSIGGELYKIRRRLMSKVLLLIGALIILVALCFILLSAFLVGNAISNVICEPLPGGAQNCHSVQNPTNKQRKQMQEMSRRQMTALSTSLRLPGSLTGTIGIINSVGLILLIILTATIVGGEYSVGTVRLLLTRGPTRTQFLLAKVLTTLICILITLIILVPFGIIVGAVLNLTLGINTSFSFLTGEWVLHAVLYLLTAALGLFVYTMIALSLSLLGKATAAGLATAIVWWFLDGIITGIIGVATNGATGPVADFIRAIPDYFIGNNLSALLEHQAPYLTGGQASTAGGISDLHALLVLVGWLVVLLGLAWWVNQRRDMTN